MPFNAFRITFITRTWIPTWQRVIPFILLSSSSSKVGWQVCSGCLLAKHTHTLSNARVCCTQNRDRWVGEWVHRMNELYCWNHVKSSHLTAKSQQHKERRQKPRLSCSQVTTTTTFSLCVSNHKRQRKAAEEGVVKYVNRFYAVRGNKEQSAELIKPPLSNLVHCSCRRRRRHVLPHLRWMVALQQPVNQQPQKNRRRNWNEIFTRRG